MSTDKQIDETQPIEPTPDADPVQDTVPLDTAGSTGAAPKEQLPLEPRAAEPFTSQPAAAEPRTVPASTPSPQGPAAKPARPTLRVGTVVWGLVLAVIGAGVIAVAAGARFDLQLAFIGLLALGGIGLLAGSIATSVRHRSR